MKFSKKMFDEKDTIDELFSTNGDFGGDKPVIAHTQITTDTQKSFDDESDYVEDIPQTTNSFAAKTKNRDNLFGQTNMGLPGGSTGGYYESKKYIKSKILEFEDLNKNNDLNDNNIPDIKELGNSILINKTNSFINVINNNSLSGDELGIVLNYVLTNLNNQEIPNQYKDIFKNLFN